MLNFYLGCLIFGVIFSVISIFFDDILGGMLDSFDISHGGLLNTTVLVSGLAVLGGAGLILTSSTTWNAPLVFTAAALVAILFSILFYFLYIKPMRNAENNTGFSVLDLVGKEGEIILAIPANGYGEVLLNVGAAGNTGQIAASEAGAIEQGTQVVVQAVKDGVLYVSPVPKNAVFDGDGKTNDRAPDTTPVSFQDCKAKIAHYLRENKSTPFFNEKLSAVVERLDTLGLRFDHLQSIIVKRFGPAGLTYDKFSAPVTALQAYLVQLVTGFTAKMRLFNDAEYSRKISEFTQQDRQQTAQDYSGLEQEYKDAAKKIIVLLDEAILKLDQLTLEIAKLGDADIEQAMRLMHDLDALIKNVRLYK